MIRSFVLAFVLVGLASVGLLAAHDEVESIEREMQRLEGRYLNLMAHVQQEQGIAERCQFSDITFSRLQYRRAERYRQLALVTRREIGRLRSQRERLLDP